MTDRVIIVGGGQGGFQVAASLRTEGFTGAITIIGDEAHLPYQRPPLSKGILLGKQEERHAVLRPAEFYEKQSIERITARVHAIGDEHVALAGGRRLEFAHLVVATGARNRELPVPGAEHLLYVRTLDEAAALKDRLVKASSVVVIGGGFIGLEVAAAACTLGKQVSVIEAQPRLMARVLAPAVSAYFRAQHEARGVRIILNAAVERVEPDAVFLRDGTRLESDLTVAGIGVIPNMELASGAGLATSNGIRVDESLQTSRSNIFAIGDCAEYPNPFAGGRVRLESVQNAVDQAACVAKQIATGTTISYRAAPWFWSDQFDIHLQMAGLSTGADQTVTRGDPASHKFSVFYYREGLLRAIDSINRPAEHLTARKLIAAGVHVPSGRAADDGFDLKSLL